MEEGRSKRPASAVSERSGPFSRTPFTGSRHRTLSHSTTGSEQLHTHQAATVSCPVTLVGGRAASAGVAVGQKKPRSILQLKNLNQHEVDALVYGKMVKKPPLQRAQSFPCHASGNVNDQDMQMRDTMRELRECRYLRTNYEVPKEADSQ